MSAPVRFRRMGDTPKRRRIDRVSAEDFLDGMTERSAAELRAMRDECREEEGRLSYARRLLHGQLDIASAELARRDSPDAESLVNTLAEVLADAPRTGPGRSAQNAEIYMPTGPSGRRRGDEVLDTVPLGKLPDLTDEELVRAVTTLTDEERYISELRRTVQTHLDQLQQELIVRYRDGGTSIDEVVPPRT